jgi:hypothetical protein
LQGRSGEGLDHPPKWGGAGERFSFQRDIVAVATAGGEGLGFGAGLWAGERV